MRPVSMGVQHLVLGNYCIHLFVPSSLSRSHPSMSTAWIQVIEEPFILSIVRTTNPTPPPTQTLTCVSFSESICCFVLNEYNALNTWFILKAHNRIVAKEWMKQISAAQVAI